MAYNDCRDCPHVENNQTASGIEYGKCKETGLLLLKIQVKCINHPHFKKDENE